MIKVLIKKLITNFISIIFKGKIGRFIQNEMALQLMVFQKNVEHNGCNMRFTAPNMLNYFRVDTFSTKEPETLQWIDSMDDDSILWDIGSNVGLYAIYAAKKRNFKVYAFEPSVFNLELLARNIFINNLTKKITIIPLPLSDELKVSSLNMSSTDWGGALSTFDQKYGHDGKDLNQVFQFNTIGISINNAVNMLHIPAPDYIKIDVDGIEHLILEGGINELKNIKSILIEVNEVYKEQNLKVKKILTQAGLVLKEKRQTDLIPLGEEFNQAYNQIWIRK